MYVLYVTVFVCNSVIIHCLLVSYSLVYFPMKEDNLGLLYNLYMQICNKDYSHKKSSPKSKVTSHKKVSHHKLTYTNLTFDLSRSNIGFFANISITMRDRDSGCITDR